MNFQLLIEKEVFYLGNNNFYGTRKNVLRELADGFSCIRENYKYFNKLSKSGYKVLGACEWLLDNIYLIEKEFKGIKMELPIDYFKGLPSISRESQSMIWSESLTQGRSVSQVSSNKELIPRIFVVAKNYINNEDEISCNKFIDYINELQEQGIQNDAAFTMGELWAFPLMLKIASF